jgi:hypothetical protein
MDKQSGWEMNTLQKVQRYKMDTEDKDAEGTTYINPLPSLMLHSALVVVCKLNAR